MTTIINRMPRALIPLLVALLVLAGLAPVAFADTGEESPGTTSQLVDDYEGQQPFRGIANEQLASRDGRLQLGVVEVLTGFTGDPIERDGYVELGATSAGANVVAASDGAGMDRFGLVINDRNAEQHRFPVVLPADAIVAHESTGAIEVRSSAGDTTLAPAMAVDAAGQQVPARYRITGSEMVIDIDLDNATLPVFVDPVSANYWWGFQDWYSRSEVRAFAEWWDVARIAGHACNWLPGWIASICRTAVSRYVGWVSSEWRAAKAEGKCLTMRMTWTGWVTSVQRYACNWG